MTLSRQNITQLAVEKSIQHRISVLRRHFLSLVNQFLACSISRPSRYRLLPPQVPDQPASPPSTHTTGTTSRHDVQGDSFQKTPFNHDHSSDPDLVPLKITLLGDCRVGKTSFLEKYVGDEKVQGGTHSHRKGLTRMDKTIVVSGARISFCIWEVNGDRKNDQDHILKACKDSVSILFMFDLTSRCTLNSVISWYKEATKSNQTAIPVLIGTKFDEFIQLPMDMQWTIASEARAIAKALKATLFFSSTTYNINVNKVFKFITAKLFDLPWTVERNLNVGEPIIDF